MKKVTNKVLWLFAIGQLGTSMLSGIIINWLVFFYQPNQETINAGQTLFIWQGKFFIGLTIIGAIAAIGRIVDAFTDPLIASKSDACKHKDGRRIPFMKMSAIPLGIITVLVFISPVNYVSSINSFFLLVTCLLYYIFMTLYCVPYSALIPDLGKTQTDRINVTTFTSVTFFVGTAISYLVPNIANIFKSQYGYTNSIRITIGIIAIIAVICMFVPVFTIKEKDYVDTKPSKTPAFESLMKTFRNKEFQTFVMSDTIYWIALTIFQTGMPFYITSLMKLEASMSFVLFAIMTTLSLAFYVPVNFLSRKIGKKKLVVFAFLLFSVDLFITSFSGMLGIGGMINGVIVAVLGSIPMAILGIIPPAIVADIAQCDSIETEENREGMFYAARTFCFKLGQSVAIIIFTALAKIGTGGQGYRVSAIIAAIFCLMGGIIFLKYNEKKIFLSIKEN